MNRFSGKRILVTGATSGIGLAGVKRIAGEGGSIIATGRDPERLEKLRTLLPDGSVVFQNDASDPTAADALAYEIREHGRIDGLWLNAGYATVGKFEHIDAAAFDALMAANVRGPVLQLAKLADHLNNGASVVVTASTSAYEGAAMASLYAAAKGALISLVRCWASALGQRGIRVNTLVPGPIDTNFRNFMSDNFRREFEADVVNRLSLARVGSAEEAAAVGLFLLSDDASFVTGSQYFVDGGLTKR
ncbi:SDR family oxidoreductase [Sodalis sp. RH14]|uniref:SDR family oxidoreductase n=1 Tax=unclassified Sodalis (in: enterobacteria) TaxID=2636512 RepID=UPI0039B4B314